MSSKRRYAGAGRRGAVPKQRQRLRPVLHGGTGRVSVSGAACVFFPVPLDRDGAKALIHAMRQLGVCWTVCESYGDAERPEVQRDARGKVLRYGTRNAPAPQQRPEDSPLTRFRQATAFIVWAGDADTADSSAVLRELRLHKYCRNMLPVTTPAGPGGWDGTKLARGKFVPGIPVDVRETAEEFAARWERAAEWADAECERFGIDGDAERDAVASWACDMARETGELPADMEALAGWVQGKQR